MCKHSKMISKYTYKTVCNKTTKLSIHTILESQCDDGRRLLACTHTDTHAVLDVKYISCFALSFPSHSANILYLSNAVHNSKAQKYNPYSRAKIWRGSGSSYAQQEQQHQRRQFDGAKNKKKTDKIKTLNSCSICLHETFCPGSG